MAEERALLVWRNYAQLKGQRKIIRSGFGLQGVYDYDVNNPWEPGRSESVLEHVMGVVDLILMVSVYYPEVIPRTELPFYILEAAHHELGEDILGDLPDDGRRDEREKNRRELVVMQQYCQKLPPDVSCDLEIGFREMQSKSSLKGQMLYGFDKIEAVLQGLLFERDGRAGDLNSKAKIVEISEQDRKYMQKTGSSSLVDVWGAHFMDLMEGMECKALFMEILRAAVEDVRGKWFDWI